MRYKIESVVMGGKTPIAGDIYDVMITEAAVKTREGGQPTLRVRCEIVNPTSCKMAGVEYATAGRIFYLMPNVIDPSVDYGLGRIIQGLQKSKFDFTKFNPEGEVDTEAFGVIEKHTMSMYLASKEEFYTRPCLAGEAPDLVENRQELKYITDLNGNKLSKGFEIVNNRGRSPSLDDVVGPALGAARPDNSPF